MVTLRVVAREVLQRFALHSSASHTRSLPNRGPCLVVPRDRPLGRRLRGAALAFIRVRDRWEDVYRSLVAARSWLLDDLGGAAPALVRAPFRRGGRQAMTFPQSLLDTLRTSPDRPAFEHGPRTVSRGELVEIIRRLAAGGFGILYFERTPRSTSPPSGRT